MLEKVQFFAERARLARQLRDEQAASSWLRSALQSSLERDTVDALNGALVLAAALDAHLRSQLDLEETR